ncbi:growth arrest-specific protein 8 [Salpingoeca rosetta]|uniref:Growth arrest-specific protein 8 n=1 Tax=Salpingoeca rosetta (strain ATCC 50818 / BSB-021) TaxID=946362 RepID=F2TYU9_SALR5|nr:growth arrest-specific protein 8 [Salpingoeca rosetta]EGD78773.1 growth arrest-specific protein 8 [Salpingoeca rosetta]|eukprot:XP_004997729.1 growth arrest-specific protein 8 [Salpingoeca rosetta]
MPPKKKGKGKGKKGKGKGKGKAEDDAKKAEAGLIGLTPEEMEGKIMRLRDELDREREERNYFQLERDKINTFWEITKKQLEESRAVLRNKDREMEEIEEKHAVEIKVYKQKVKHLLYEHQNQITELKTDAAMNLRLARDELSEDSVHLRRDKRDLKVSMKEQELDHIAAVKQLQVEYDKKMTQLYEEKEQQGREIRQKYEQMMDALQEDMNLQRKAEIHEIEERKNQQIHTLVKNHEKAFSDIKNYYNDITLNNLALINTLKEQVEEMKKREERTDKLMAEVASENKKLVVPLQEAQARVAELEKQLASHERDKKFLRNAKARIKVLEDETKQLEWEREVLKQRFAEVEGERDELYERFVKTIYDVQQKSGFKNIILEKKLSALAESLEKKEAQLNEVLAASNLDPTALAVVTRKLEDVLDSKNAAIKDLQYEVAKMYKTYNDTVRTFQSKMGEFGIPMEELGFQLLNPDPDQPLGKAPAGLVSTTS